MRPFPNPTLAIACLVVALSPGCRDQKAAPPEPPAQAERSTAPAERLAAPAQPAETTSSTTSATARWQDTTRLLDTALWVTRGRDLSTTQTVTITQHLLDSSWIVPLPRGIPLGLAALPPAELCKRAQTGYSLTVLAVGSTTPADLAKVAECGGKVIERIPRPHLKGDSVAGNPAGCLDVAKATQRIRAWNWKALRAAIAKGTLLGIEVGDDVAAALEWCGYLEVVLPKWDSIACAVQDSAESALGKRDFAVGLRMLATQGSRRGGTWNCLRMVRAQYAGIRRHGHPDSFAVQQTRSAAAQKLAVVFGFNYVNAGCGPAGPTSLCLPGVPGTNRGSALEWEPSAPEVVRYSLPQLRQGRTCGHASWSYEYGKAYFERPEIQVAMKQLADSARARKVTTPCVIK